MIDLMFEYGNDFVIVRIEGKTLRFGNTLYGPKLATIEGLKLSYTGVIKEHPDLKNCSSWRQEAIARFKEKMSDLKTEKQIEKYVMYELTRFGYIPKYKQVKGFRKEAIKWHG